MTNMRELIFNFNRYKIRSGYGPVDRYRYRYMNTLQIGRMARHGGNGKINETPSIDKTKYEMVKKHIGEDL